MTSATNELRVFISSTFRDLQEEREHLVKRIFPEIRALCGQRGVTFTEVDLRWGITQEEAEREGIIRICLDEIDRCRPYFIGILGERYGWTPSPEEADRVSDEFPIIVESISEGASITEMEIVHGVLANPAMAGHAFFYFRDRAATPTEFIEGDSDAISRLNALKDRIRQSGFPVREGFSSPAELGAWLEEDLRRVVDAEHPESEAPSALEVERRAHQAFAASRTRAYIPNPQHLEQFNDWEKALRVRDWGVGNEQKEEVSSPTPNPSSLTPLIISGESGLGKSSLTAYLVDCYRQKHPTAFVIEHYVGASRAGGTATALMRHIVEEIRERFAIEDPLPSKPEDLERSFANWLYRCEDLAAEEGIGVLIAIDAVNQLDESGRLLAWLPKMLPEGLRVMISTTPGEPQQRLVEREWNQLTVGRLEDERFRQRIVVRYLGEFRKSINPEQMRRVTSDAKASSPLYLRVVAEELRLHGMHETLDELIGSYAAAADLHEVFDRVLERFEKDYGEMLVTDFMRLVWASRSGLSETELLELTGLNRLELSRLLFALEYHFVRREGRLGFFHDYLRRAVETRYLPDEASRYAMHDRLAGYFQTGVDAAIARDEAVPLSLAADLCHQLRAGEKWASLRDALTTIPVYLALADDRMKVTVMEYWRELAERFDIEAAYRSGLQQWSGRSPEECFRAVLKVAELLDRMSCWDGAVALCSEWLASAVDRGRRNEEAVARLRLGWLHFWRRDLPESLAQAEQARDISTEIGDRNSEASAYGVIGLVNRAWGQIDRALESLLMQQAIYSELGNEVELAGALHNVGAAYETQGRNEEALDQYRQAFEINRSRGNRNWMAHNLINMGNIHLTRGDYPQALEHYSQALRMYTDLGIRSGITLAMGNLGSIYAEIGEHQQAMEFFSRALAVQLEMGDRQGVSLNLGNIATIHAICGEHQLALENFVGAIEAARAAGDRGGLAEWLAGASRSFLELSLSGQEFPESLPIYLPDATRATWIEHSIAEARKCAAECVAISTEIQQPETLFSGQTLLARIAAVEGDAAGATATLQRMVAQADDEEQRAELHYLLWKLAAADSDHRLEALHRYEALLESSPKPTYRHRVDELSARPPTEQHDGPE